MFPASTNGGGQCFIVPDVCKTPTPGGPVPTPYPNTAMNTQASGGTCCGKVKIVGKKTIVKGTEISMSSGDEAGTIGGVVSNRFKGPAKFRKGSSKVKAEGKEVCHLTSTSGQNGAGNSNVPPGVQVAPSQSKVLVMP
jgi:hypothetical protein